MAVDTSIIGKPTGAWHVTVERAPVTAFANALHDGNPVYRDARAAHDAGFDGIPAPPTFTFAMGFRGSFAEPQPEDPTGGGQPQDRGVGGAHAEGAPPRHRAAGADQPPPAW